jgi:hypothetical protein
VNPIDPAESLFSSADFSEKGGNDKDGENISGMVTDDVRSEEGSSASVVFKEHGAVD